MTGLISVAGSTPSDEGFELKSVRYDGPGSNNGTSYLTKTFPAGGNQKTWTLSVWVKKSGVNVGQQNIICPTGTPESQLGFNGDYLHMYEGGSVFNLRTMEVFRDPSAWYHIVVAVDTTQSTEANRIKMYSNNRLITVFNSPSEDNYPAQDTSLKWNAAVEHAISKYGHTTGAYFVGYMAEFYWIDGYQLTPSYFGATNEKTNQWQPTNPTTVKQAVTFGTNGFYLPFSNDALATSFTDSSNDFTHIFTPTEALTVDCLVVAGGGSAGGSLGGSGSGGGGAGGYRTNSALSVGSGTVYTIIVGSGGAGTPAGSIDGTNGGDSSISGSDITNIVSAGGGGGAKAHDTVSNDGLDGGSGGGAGGAGSSASGGDGGDSFPVTSPVQGYRGGNQTSGGGYGCGGGGSSAQGGDGASTAGGAGTSNDITGASVTYAEGGGSGNNQPGADAPPNTGNGGQGAGQAYNGGAGGSGIVIISYISTTAKATGGIITTYTSGADTYQVHKFLFVNHTITANGDAKNVRVSNHPVNAVGDAHIIGPKIGSSAIAFDGTGDELTAPSSVGNFGSSDFTLECWINGTSTADGIIMGQIQSGGTDEVFIRRNSSTTYIRVRLLTDAGDYNMTGTATTSSNTWYHIAATRDGDTLRSYVNGVQDTTIAISGSVVNPTSVFGIGSGGDWTSDRFDGYIDEVRVSDTCRYPNGTTFTPDTTAFISDADTELLIHSNTTMGSTTFTDSSSNDHTITANGDVMNVAPKIGVGMGVFDGSGDSLTAPNSNDWDWGSGNFTMETWIYVLSTAPANSNRGTIINRSAGTSDNYWNFRVENTQLDFFVHSSGSYSYTLSTASSIITHNQWHHVAVVKDGNDYELFVDGTSRASDTETVSWPSLSSVLRIGAAERTSVEDYFDGYMDELRISKTVRYTTTFTPSTTAFKDDKDTVLLLHMDGGGGISQTTFLPTLPGQGTYFYDDSVDAIFYDSATGVPTNKSIISFPGSDDYLSLADSSDWNFGTDNFTWEFWVNFAAHYNSGGDGETFVKFGDYPNEQSYIYYYPDNSRVEWDWRDYQSPHGFGTIVSSSTDWPLGEWIHIAAVRNGTTFTLYRNGVSVGTDTDSTAMTPEVGNSGFGLIIGGSNATQHHLNGFMDQVRISNIARYTSAFTPPTTPFTADANTKLLIQSDFSEGGLGADHSGNYNYFTPTNLTSDDMMLDSPMNNFCTLNSINGEASAGGRKSYQTLSEGNLKSVGSSASDTGVAPGTWSFGDSGKWYYEFVATAFNGNYPHVGMVDALDSENQGGYVTNGVMMRNDGQKIINSSNSSYGSSTSVGDVIGMAVDCDNGAAYFSINNTWQDSGDPTSGGSQTGAAYTWTAGTIEFTPTISAWNTSSGAVANFGQDSSFAGNKTAQGNQDGNNKGDFYYEPPSGFLALCTDNLSAPGIALPTDYFNTVLYSGTGASNAITGVGFQPDLIWLKTRESGDHWLSDVIQTFDSGGSPGIRSNTTGAQVTYAGYGVSAVGSDGFTVIGNGGLSNGSSNTYAAWNWKAGTTFDPKDDGTIAVASGSKNTTAGFSILKYTGESGTPTVGHGLGVTPDLIIIKQLTDGYTYNWNVASLQIGDGAKRLQLDTSGEQVAGSGLDSPYIGSSVFTLSDGTSRTNDGSSDYIAYCFANIEGYSKVGKYTGNGNADGPFVYTGFRPAFLLYKRIDVAANWRIVDNARNTYNVVGKYLSADTDDAESDSAQVDFDSNGIKVRAGSVNPINVSGGTYLYYAVAETPFKTANAR